jgi:hypothetical protein
MEHIIILLFLLILVYSILSKNNIEGYDSTRINSKNQNLHSLKNMYYWTPHHGYQPNLTYIHVVNHSKYPEGYIPNVPHIIYPDNTR